MLNLLLSYALNKAFESVQESIVNACVKRNVAYIEGEAKRLNQTQFTMLGMTGAGKTCYLLGMYKKMLSGLKGFSLTTDDDTDVSLRRRYKRMTDASLGQERFPAGTDQTDFYDFTLEHGFSPILPFRWIDYPGGMLDEKTDGDIEQYNVLEEYVRNSSSLFICVDGALLQGDDNTEKINLLQEKCSDLINPFLSRYLKNNDFLPPTALVVTKSDLCKDDTKPEDLEEIIKDVFNPLFVQGEESPRFVAVIAVSIGQNISENGYQGKLSPKNLQLPIFMGVLFSLGFYMRSLERRIARNESVMRDCKREIDDEKWYWEIFRDQEKIKDLERAADTIGQAIHQGRKSYNKALQDSVRLLDDLEKNVKLVYLNGKTYESFSEASSKYMEMRR